MTPATPAAEAIEPRRRYEWESDPDIDRESGKVLGLDHAQRQAIVEREIAIGVYPLDILLARRARLVERGAELAARHDKGGTYDAERKHILSKLGIAELDEQDGKPNVSEADMRAHAHPAYGRWLAAMRKQKVEYEILKDKLDAIERRIQRDQRILDYATRELGALPR